MVEWKIEKDIVFLIKTMKGKHLSDTLNKGQFCFSHPEVFSNPAAEKLCTDQIDAWDSRHFFTAEDIYCYPIIGKNGENAVYGKGFKLANKSTMLEISNISQHTPFCSFRKITVDDLSERDGKFCFSLGDTVDRIKEKFGHDSYVLILRPDCFVRQLEKLRSCYGKSIIYGDLSLEDKTDFEEKELAGFPQIKMFQKREIFEWHKEYRIILTPTEKIEPQIIEIGSITDYAIGGNIDELRLGYAFDKPKG